MYASIIEGDIDIDSPLLGVSQNNPMLISNSSPEIETITTNKGKRGVNFSVDEDKLLVLAWLNTSLDPTHGNELKQETFRQKIWQYFCNHNAASATRTPISLSSQWRMINKETSRFCGFLASLEGLYQSGTTEQDEVNVRDIFYVIS